MIVDDVGIVVDSMRNLSVMDSVKYGIPQGLDSPFYFYGDPIDINKQLIQLDKAAKSDKKYPAIALRLPTSEVINNGMVHYDLNIGIFEISQLDWTSDQRFDEVIKPILKPLYELFIDRLLYHGFIYTGKVPDHTKVIKPYYGVEGTQGNKAYVFENKLDAIEIINLKVKSIFKKC